MHRSSILKRIQRALLIVLPILIILLIFLLVLHGKQTSLSQTSDTEHPSAPDAASDDLPDADESEIETIVGEIGEISEPVQTTATLLFTGDVYLSPHVQSNYDADGIDGVISAELLNELQQADLTIINQEFPFSTRGTPAEDKQYTFCVNPSYTRILTELGVDVAGLANNHVLDYGADALLDTFATLEDADISYIGAGDSLARASALITKEIGGTTFGFLAASRVIPVISWDVRNAQPGVFTTYDPALLLQAIEQARSQCDYLTVLVHWGVERDSAPQEYQTQLAEQYIDAGADLIIGAHPHVLQGISYYKGKPICYSLGNFIFNQEIPQTLAVKVTVTPNETPILQLLAASASGARTVLYEAGSEKSNEIFEYMERISENITISSDGIVSEKE